MNAKSYTVRRAESDDYKGLNALANTCGGTTILRATFGAYNFNSIIENAFLTLVANSNNEELSPTMCCLCLNDCASLSSDSESFATILDGLNYYIPVTVNNTLFLNFWMLNEALHISRECGFDIIRQAFVLCPNVDFIIWLCPVNYITTDFVDNTFSVLDLEYSDERKKIAVGVPTGSKVLFLHRSNFLSKLFVREARVEDNDDLLPILRTSNPDVVAGQEDFFLAELIQQQDDRNHFFVGLDNNQIVGMLATSLDVNVSLLLRIFDFDAFPDVIIQRIQRPPPPPLLVGLLGDIRLINFDEMCEALADKDCVFVNASDIILDSNDRDASNEEKNSADFPDTILKYIRSMESQGTVKAQPSAYLIYGYPRDENEAYDNLREVFSFDYLLQLENTNEDDEEDEDDEVLQNHLDAVEVLKENFRPTEGPVFPEWLKVSMDSSEDGKAMNIHHLATEVDKILKKRADAIIYQKKLDDEQPPEANAFAVTVFCMDEEFTSRSNDLLKIAFEDHPRHDYCLFMVPNAKSSSAITQTMTFVRTRAGLSFDQSLFLMHRSAFVAQQFMRIERFSLKSSKELRFFVDKMPKNDGLEMIKRCEQIVKENSGVELKDNPSEVVFLATINSLVVGVFIISRKALSNDDTTWFRANYQLDSIVNFENYRSRSQAIVQHWIIDPIYSKCSKSILREIMRQYGKLLLYYHADMTYTPEKEILEEFIHVPPRSLREQVSGGEAVEYSKKPSSEGSEAKSPLFVITKKMLSKAKDIVCKRVVVVGGTSHAMAALDTILSVPYLYFPNVFLVLDYLPQPMRIHAKPSLHDHYTGKLPDALAPYEYNGCLSVNQVDFPTERELYARGLAHKVRIVRGKLTDIDRENKAVVVSDEVVVEYDLLLIASNTKDNTTRKLPTVSGLHPVKCARSGIFELGCPLTDAEALNYVSKSNNDDPEVIVVYGSAIKCLTAVSRLLKAGISFGRIVAVVKDAPGCIDDVVDPAIIAKVMEGIDISHITVMWGHEIEDVSIGRNGLIERVIWRNLYPPEEVEEDVEPVPTIGSISCAALLCCNDQQCDKDVFCAINDSGLVFDGGLVVDNHFRTGDPNIYAAGDFTRFSMKFKGGIAHSRFNPREVGTFVALAMLKSHLDPFTVDDISTVVDHDYIAPMFGLARSFVTDLPGDLVCFVSSTPKRSEEFQSLSTAFPRVDDGSVCSIRNSVLKVDFHGKVIQFFYVGEDPVEPYNLRHIPGKHEALLNSACYAYSHGLVQDWIAFFRSNWCHALFHDQFIDLLASLRRVLQTDKGTILVMNRVFENAEENLDNLEVSNFRREFIGTHGEKLSKTTDELIEEGVNDFLRKNKHMLSSYHVTNK